jgi:hypothetical protein
LKQELKIVSRTTAARVERYQSSVFVTFERCGSTESRCPPPQHGSQMKSDRLKAGGFNLGYGNKADRKDAKSTELSSFNLNAIFG